MGRRACVRGGHGRQIAELKHGGSVARVASVGWPLVDRPPTPIGRRGCSRAPAAADLRAEHEAEGDVGGISSRRATSRDRGRRQHGPRVRGRKWRKKCSASCRAAPSRHRTLASSPDEPSPRGSRRDGQSDSTRAPARSYPRSPPTAHVISVAFSGDGQFVATGRQDKNRASVRRGHRAGSLAPPCSEIRSNRVAFSRDRTLVVAGADDA